MISVKENIKACKAIIDQLKNQRNDITNEILRLEGSLKVFVDMDNAGVSEIVVPKNPLETSEVIDGVDVQASGSEQKQENGSTV